ncbi:DUF2231 domain-containing protein [Candidatus Nitrospira allomarina]|uniref:DUF2231 domain-containing protein n=1 Tax=Candidatus Nitrospira allomarina TaxID=3020900 RepID=A0AA96GE31_9BACT|nr:DUF2231 domain-containing protein [Candidatus Nitrospira allomarina]WNM59946.1 hypothetical protein PP769_09365 [Candidatus Nitrospira allomarina]
MLVPFPNASLFTSMRLDAAGVWLKCENFRDGPLWPLILGFLGGGAAAMAGHRAEEAAEAGIAESMIETHGTHAFVTLGLLGVLL